MLWIESQNKLQHFSVKKKNQNSDLKYGISLYTTAAKTVRKQRNNIGIIN